MYLRYPTFILRQLNYLFLKYRRDQKAFWELQTDLRTDNVVAIEKHKNRKSMKNCVLCDSICKKKQMKSWMTAVKGRLNYDFKKLEHSYFFFQEDYHQNLLRQIWSRYSKSFSAWTILNIHKFSSLKASNIKPGREVIKETMELSTLQMYILGTALSIASEHLTSISTTSHVILYNYSCFFKTSVVRRRPQNGHKPTKRV